MITILKPQTIQTKISTFDIETDVEGDVLDIGLSTEKEYHTFSNWENFLYYIMNNHSRLSITRLYAHNGGNFDTVNLLVYLRSDRARAMAITNPRLIILAGRIMSMEFDIPNLDGSCTDKFATIRIMDSFCLAPMSLNKLLKSFGFEQKIEIGEQNYGDMRKFRDDNSEKYHEYLKWDCEGLRLVLIEYEKIINNIAPIGDLRLSIAANALAVFRTAFLEKPITTPGKKESDYTREAYKGGRTEYYRKGNIDKNGVLKNCNYYDINSMYPAVMMTNEFPIINGIYTRKLAYKNHNELYHGIYRVKYSQKNGHIAIAMGIDENGKREKNYSFVGEGYLTHFEIQYLLELDSDIEVIDGYYYPQNLNIFTKYVRTLYDFRLQCRENGNTAFDLICKLLMNNLYGKFGQGDDNEKIDFMTFEELDKLNEQGIKYQTLSLTPDNKNRYAIAYIENKPCYTAIPTIAALITGACRVQITKAGEKYYDYLIYGDTDSLILQGEMDAQDISSSQIGMFKIEHSNIDVVVWGKKGYAIKKTQFSFKYNINESVWGKEKYALAPIPIYKYEIKQKGLPVRSLDQNFVGEMIKQKEAVRKFKSPTKVLTALKNDIQNPSKFLERERKITADLSSEEKGLLR